MASMFEWTMKIPLASVAQVRILSEGVVEPGSPVVPVAIRSGPNPQIHNRADSQAAFRTLDHSAPETCAGVRSHKNAQLRGTLCRMVQIAIIGGGIGGLTAALALQQSGFQFEVFEQAPELHDVGAAIAIWPNAMRVLRRLNLADKILEKAGVMEEIRWVDQNGWLINRVSIADPNALLSLFTAQTYKTLSCTRFHPSSIHLGHELIVQTTTRRQDDRDFRQRSLDRSRHSDRR